MPASLTALTRCLLLISVLCALAGTTGCGLKGDLYLPESPPPAGNTSENGDEADAEDRDSPAAG